ncbi:MAG: radical SAM protein [Chloroflexota bacterium]
MDIIYVHAGKQEANARYDKYRACAPYPFIPVGVIGMVNMLRKEGWSVQGINLPVELLGQPGFDFRMWLARQSRAKMVMIDLHWYEHCYGAIDAARAVKEVWSKTPVVIGGLTSSNFAEEILDNFDVIDYVVRGDSEEPIRLLAQQLCGQAEGEQDVTTIPNLVYRQPGLDGKASQNPRSYFAKSADLDSLDFVSMDWLHNYKRYASLQYSGVGTIAIRKPKYLGHWLTIGRGCVFNCTYCGGGKKSHTDLAGRNGYVVRDPENVVNDIQRLQELGYHQVSLSLDPATFQPKWWKLFFRLMQERNVDIGLYNEFFQLPSHEFIDEFAKTANLQHTEVAISPLSGDEGVRKKNGKYYKNGKFLKMLEKMREHRIPIFIYFSLNLPGETPQTFKKTLKLAEQIGKVYPHDLLRMLNPCHTLDPVSPMSRQPDAYDMQVHYTNFMDYYNYCQGTGWEPRQVVRGQHRGYEMNGRPAQIVEKMAQIWDVFAQQQQFQCFPVPRGW